MKFAKAHYFEKKCNNHCPHLERIVDLDSMDRSTPFTALPPEILFHIATQVRKGKKLCLLLSSCKLLAAISHHSTLLKQKKGCNCETKEADNSEEEKVCDRCKKEYSDDGNGDPVWIEKIQKVKEKIDSIVVKADVFMHGYHTCHNENLNTCRTKDTPKDKNLPTFGDRAFLSALRRNLGGKGSTTASTFGELGLNITTGVQQHLDNLDEQETRNRKRKQSKAFKKREQELRQQQKARAEQEKKISKKKGDTYLDKHQKSLVPVFEEDTHTKQKKQKTAPDLSVAKVSTVEEVSKLQGKALEAQIILFNLFKTYKGDSTKEGQKKRLAEFVSDPSASQHYVRPHKPRATPPRCSSFSAVAAHSQSSAV